MPGQQRGPLCATTAKPIDSGTNCRFACPCPDTLGKTPNNITDVPVSFPKLWTAYPTDHPYVDSKGNTPKGFENQCAIKLSVALSGAEVSLKSFHGATVSVGKQKLAIRAEELATWLHTDPKIQQQFRRSQVTGQD